jgi:hypothetical protein
MYVIIFYLFRFENKKSRCLSLIKEFKNTQLSIATCTYIDKFKLVAQTNTKNEMKIKLILLHFYFRLFYFNLYTLNKEWIFRYLLKRVLNLNACVKYLHCLSIQLGK